MSIDFGKAKNASAVLVKLIPDLYQKLTDNYTRWLHEKDNICSMREIEQKTEHFHKILR